LRSLHGVGEGRRGAHCAAAREEAAALPAHLGWEEGEGGGGGLGHVSWLGLPGRMGPEGRVGRLASGPKVEEDFFSDKY
jgi:hypothetical protein